MTPEQFWTTYAGGQSPAQFMRMFPSRDLHACAEAYMHERPTLYGIVRRGTWRNTFKEAVQHTRLEVELALATHLDETRDEWEPELDAPRPEA